MYKDEMIQLHQFLVYVLKYLAVDDQISNDCSEYDQKMKLMQNNFSFFYPNFFLIKCYILLINNLFIFSESVIFEII